VTALRTAVADVDAAFLRRARAEGLAGGTTAVFALQCGQRLLVGSIGDSYAILCGSSASCGPDAAPTAGRGTALSTGPPKAAAGGERAAGASGSEHGVRAQVLSALHSPDRQDEKRRIEQAGGWVQTTAGQARHVLTACRECAWSPMGALQFTVSDVHVLAYLQMGGPGCLAS
jgi:Protein phosphatase 2C